MGKSILNIVAISSGAYPSNSAANVRHLAILRGMVENGAKASLFSIYAQGNSIPRRDNYNGVDIEHAIIRKEGNLIGRVCWPIVGLSLIMLTILRYKREKKLDVVIIYTPKISFLLPLILLFKIARSNVVHERTEYPFLNSKGLLIQLQKYLYLRLVIPMFDGLFVISSSLVEYFSHYYKRKILLVPIVVEPSRFENQHRNVFPFSYVAYCGNLSYYKDGVDILIDSFAEVVKEFPDYKLLLVGNLDKSPDKLSLLQQIDDLDLKERK